LPTKSIFGQKGHLGQRPRWNEIGSAIRLEDASHTFVIGILAVRLRKRPTCPA
jgi:hypothetical protein